MINKNKGVKRSIPAMASLMLLMSMGLLACGDGRLDREKAKALIIQSAHFPRQSTDKFTVGKQTFRDKNENLENFLVAKHLMTSENRGTESISITSYEVHYLELTSEGQKYKVGDASDGDQQYCVMKVADQVFVEVTGLRETVPGRSAEVEFTWKFDNITPFGEAARLNRRAERRDYNSGQLFTAKALFEKYDDGWRVKGLPGL